MSEKGNQIQGKQIFVIEVLQAMIDKRYSYNGAINFAKLAVSLLSNID